MISKLKHLTDVNLINFSGWRTKRKIVVIESDDWGSIRMPSKKTYLKLLQEGVRVDNCPYNRYDCLESEKDLMNLYDVLVQFKDINGNHPTFTANCVVANPDFNKIRESGYKEYIFEPFTETFNHYPSHQNSFNLWKQGIAANIFHPQFHGREHLNIARWMKALQDGMPETMLAFNLELFGLSTNITSEERKSYMAAQEFDTEEVRLRIHGIIRCGLKLFEKIFGFRSLSFIAANYTWGCDLHEVLHKNGVRYLQGSSKQSQPRTGGKPNISIRRYMGEKNEYNQTFIIRNCFFEPSLNPGIDPVDTCLKEISIAFLWNKPAVISSHRLNYIGEIEPENRNRNLSSLKSLIQKVQKKWPEIEFFTSDQLGALINNRCE